MQHESLRLNPEVGDRRGIAACLNGFTALALTRGRLEQAARLLGAASRLAEAGPFVPPDDDLRQRTVAVLRARLGHADLDGAWSAGRNLPLDEAIREALVMDRLSPAPATGGRSAPGTR